jgi:cardiolipin synthase
LQAAGVDIEFFNQFKWRAPADFAGRTHRKLLIIDGEYALIGGAGISDLWDGVEKDDDTQPWLDVEMRLEGQVVTLLEGVFMQHFTYSGGTADLRENICKTIEADHPNLLVILGDNPTYRSSPIKAFKQNNIICARKRIWLSSPYFLPDENSRQLLIGAKKMGADVKILTTSEKSDKKPVYYASYNEYGELLRAGIEIYEYQPSMIHAKMMLIDDLWATTGSANYDPRSLFHNEELDICASQPMLVKNLEAVFQRGFAHSKQISLSNWRDRSWWKYRIVGRLVSFVQWQL